MNGIFRRGTQHFIYVFVLLINSSMANFSQRHTAGFVGGPIFCPFADKKSIVQLSKLKKRVYFCR